MKREIKMKNAQKISTNWIYTAFLIAFAFYSPNRKVVDAKETV